LQTYDLRRGLKLIFVTHPDTPELITAIHAWKDRVFAAWGGTHCGSSAGVWVFKRGKKVAELESPSSALPEPIIQLLVFGSWIVGCCGRSIHVWKAASYQHYTTLNASSGESPGEHIFSGKMCTMPTYLNKIFVGRYDGNVDMWNLISGKLIYSFSPPSPNSGAVIALQPTPALGLIAISHKNSHLTIQNVDIDQKVLSIRPASKLLITSIAFQGNCLSPSEEIKPGVMATASMGSGDITMWDLNNGGRIAGVLRGAHQISLENNGSGINRIEFLDGQPIMISSGKDNTLKSWVFGGLPFSPIPKLLHSTSGHSAPVTVLRFLPSSSDGSEHVGKWLLSASRDCSLWGLSLRNDGQAIEISQGNTRRKTKANHVPHPEIESKIGSGTLKAPEITCIACSLNQDKGTGPPIVGPIWAGLRSVTPDSQATMCLESVITGHRGDKYARTWFWGRKRAGRWAFETTDGTEVKVCYMVSL
jgi:U3 small nucleolar RNA-associated protein 21